MKNLVATDQEIDAILRDASLCQLCQLNRLQLYNSMIDSESVAESMVSPSADTTAVTALLAARRPQQPQWCTYRLVIQSILHRFNQASTILSPRFSCSNIAGSDQFGIPPTPICWHRFFMLTRIISA